MSLDFPIDVKWWVRRARRFPREFQWSVRPNRARPPEYSLLSGPLIGRKCATRSGQCDLLLVRRGSGAGGPRLRDR